MPQTDSLEELGWSAHFADQLTAADEGLVPARVSRQDVNRHLTLSEAGELAAHLPGRVRSTALSKAELPTVGDWVMLDVTQDPPQICRSLDRFSRFSRKEAGEVTEEQVVAANIDYAFIVTGLDHNFNVSRIERYLLLCQNSGAQPVIVLNKADLCENIQRHIGELQPIAGATPIHITSALLGDAVDDIRGYLANGKTGALLGSSGVGKSTMINALLGREQLATGEVRDGDSKGRHTTTHRELLRLPEGGLIIDTPGMREIQLWTDESAISEAFSDIMELASQCRFADCKHEGEPGCAVQAAIDRGDLSQERFDSYQKYLREISHLDEKIDGSLRAAKRKERRNFSKMIRKRPTKRD